MKKVIFICGMSGGKRDIFLIEKILKGFNVKYFPYDVWFSDTIEQSAKKLKNFIDKLNLKKKEKISIISVSAGGIISEYYLKFLDNKKVDKIVTICSPFKGTWLAKVFFRNHKGVQELRKGSLLLKKIQNKKLKNIKELNFWCYFDPIVPGKSAKGNNPRHTLFFLHWIIQFWPPVIYKIKEFLIQSPF